MPITELEVRSQFGLKCLQTKLLNMKQVVIGNLVVLESTSSCSEISLTISGTSMKKGKQNSPRSCFREFQLQSYRLARQTYQISFSVE